VRISKVEQQSKFRNVRSTSITCYLATRRIGCGCSCVTRVRHALERVTKMMSKRKHSRRITTAIGAFACLLFASAPSFAQRGTAQIAGVVRDTSGAVLPGVAVEASSSALIEKVRTAVTDESGQYRILELRP